jgi:hypothetical protein
MQTSSPPVSVNRPRLGAPGSIVLAIWAIAILAVVGRSIVAPHQNTVFIVFRDAGRHWLSGTNLYSQVGKYLYSPLAAAVFSLFGFLPDAAGAALWRLLIVGIYLSAVVLCLRRFEQRPTSFPVAGLLLLPLSIGSMNNGQASLLVIGLLLFACAAIEAQSWTLAAFLIAFATFFKIYPLVVGLLFAVIYPRPMALRLFLAIVALWLLSLFLQNPRYVLEQYQNWFLCLQADQRRVAGELGSWRDFWLLLRIARIPITTSVYALIQILAGGLVAIGCWWVRRNATGDSERQRTTANDSELQRTLLSGNSEGQRTEMNTNERTLWDNRRIIWTAFTFGCLWITLFGPSTEQATYVFLAPSFAMGGASIWTTNQHPNLGLYRAWFTASYLLLIAADALNAWVPVIRQNNYLHALEPIAALLFASFVLTWSLREERSQSSRPVYELR